MIRICVFVCIAVSACVLACTNPASAITSDEEANIAIVKQCFADAGAGGWRLALENVVTADVVLQWLKTEIGDVEETVTGKEAALTSIDNLEKALADLPEAKNQYEYFADGATVIVLAEQTGTDVMTDKPYLIHWACFVTLTEGKISSIRVF